MFTRLFFSLLLLFFFWSSNAQVIKIDTATKDTIKFFFSAKANLYQRISASGVLLEIGPMEGHMGHECGCEPSKHGRWMTFHVNEKLKEIGSYRCRKKIGKWLYYSEKGILLKSENYTTAFPEWARWNRQTYLSGTYKEFFDNGQLKVLGYHDIVETYEKYFTDYDENFEPINEKCCRWTPSSIPIGTWKYYSKEGKLLEEKHFEQAANQRPIETSLHKVDEVWNRY